MWVSEKQIKYLDILLKGVFDKYNDLEQEFDSFYPEFSMDERKQRALNKIRHKLDRDQASNLINDLKKGHNTLLIKTII